MVQNSHSLSRFRDFSDKNKAMKGLKGGKNSFIIYAEEKQRAGQINPVIYDALEWSEVRLNAGCTVKSRI